MVSASPGPQPEPGLPESGCLLQLRLVGSSGSGDGTPGVRNVSYDLGPFISPAASWPQLGPGCPQSAQPTRGQWGAVSAHVKCATSPPQLPCTREPLQRAEPPAVASARVTRATSLPRFPAPPGALAAGRTTGSRGRPPPAPQHDCATPAGASSPSLQESDLHCRPFLGVLSLVVPAACPAWGEEKQPFPLGVRRLPSPKVMFYLATQMVTFVPRVFVPCLCSPLWDLGDGQSPGALYFCRSLGRSRGMSGRSSLDWSWRSVPRPYHCHTYLPEFSEGRGSGAFVSDHGVGEKP